MSGALLPIGRFARLCRLSVKQLRHYDELGLLSPAHVDPATGYRYYVVDQARNALSIGLLRSLDVPLPTIGRVLAGEEPSSALGPVRERLEADLARRRRTLGLLERLFVEGVRNPDVAVVREASRSMATVREVAPPEQIGDATGRCVRHLLAALADAGVELRDPLIGLFPLDLSEEVTVAVAAASDVEVPGTSAEVLPGGSFAAATHVGPYEHISLTVHGVLAWLGERGHAAAGPIREVYLTDPANTPPEQLVTRLMIRLEDPE